MKITLTGLLIGVLIFALIATGLITILTKKKPKSWVMTFLQNYCGGLFIFSGLVKAVDPLGTAYKMEQYFDEFYTTFEGTWFGFLAPLFPMLSKQAIWFSVSMIIFEIVLGLALILGVRSKLTSWAFLLLVGFFTFLTGFTYLTGYVPAGANFFEFGKWAEYNATNMKVTDCGCFGDFLVLKPKTSFLKDVALMFPALFFVFKHKDMHQIFNGKIRTGLLTLSTIGLLFYCMSNFVWNIPKSDFRPFKKGTDVRTVKQAEDDAMAAVQITDFQLQELATGNELIVGYNEYLANYSTKYSKDKFKVLEQIKGEPTIEPTKISEFAISDLRGNDITDDILMTEGAHLMIVNYQLKGDPIRKTRMVQDSVFVLDTITTFDPETYVETYNVVKTFQEVREKEEAYVDQNFDKSYVDKHKMDLKPFTDAAKSAGLPVRMAIGKSDPESITEFDAITGLNIDYGMADDILLKTIVRSNPGIVLWKDGKILDKWHINKLPEFSSVKQQHLN